MGKKVLDAGCGGGAYVQHLLSKNFDAHGVELNDPFYQEAKKRGLGERIIKASATALPYDDKNFDTTYCFDVLEHVDDVSVMKELIRVTRKRIIVTVPRDNQGLQKFGVAFATYTDLTHLRYYTNESLRSLLSQFPHQAVRLEDEIPVDFRAIAVNTLKFESAFQPLSWFCTKALRLLVRRAKLNNHYAGIVGVIDLL